MHERRDLIRTAMQAPISQTKARVMYLCNGQQRQSAWFYSDERQFAALALMQAKYGQKNCILYVD